VKVKLVTIRNFVLCALTAGLVGLFEAIRSQTIQPDPSGPNELLLIAIAGAVIGGTLLSGGSGTVIGAFIGALFLGILKDGLILQGVNANYLLFYTGLAIVVAMTANVYVGRVRRGQRGSG
jgi:simple sugar transport system permease protein